MSPAATSMKKESSKEIMAVITKPLLTTKAIIISLALLLVLSLGAGTYLYIQTGGVKKDPQKELEQTVRAVGKLMVLPTDETPTLATVSDPEKLKDQAFFANAQVGDKVLIYTNAKKAILYSPSRNMIIEVSPLNLSSQ